MSEHPGMGAMDVTSDDRLFAALAYFFSPLVPLIIMFLEEKKNRPFIRAHNMQALILGVVNFGVAIVLGWLVFPLCINALLGIYLIYLTIMAFQGKYVNIPLVTDLVKNQGWA